MTTAETDTTESNRQGNWTMGKNGTMSHTKGSHPVIMNRYMPRTPNQNINGTGVCVFLFLKNSNMSTQTAITGPICGACPPGIPAIAPYPHG